MESFSEAEYFDCVDYVEIFQVSRGQNLAKGKFCGSKPPDPITIEGDVKIVYRTSEKSTDTTNSYGHFVLMYQAERKYSLDNQLS